MLKAEDEHAQARWLEAAKKVVKEQAFYMKRAMDGDKLDLALDHAMEMLRELKTNLLSPKSYYELYMKVQEELRELEDFLSSLQRNGRSMSEIYEQVQNCVHVVPRLYLVCCVGGVFITSQEAAAKDILTDMVEIIKGVQHPMRGLFLRNYLTQVTKNRLPDAGSVFEGAGGSVQDAYLFVLQNFTEANRLWVRLQTQGAPKDRKKREKERLDLRILVGTNLVRLSQLEGLDAYEYETNVLPKILEEVISCKDTIAQSYLMDCIIQVFPDDFHLTTLDPFLKACVQLKDKVNVRTILESMIDRLTTSFTTANSDEIGSTSNAFKLFNDCVNSINESRTNIKLIDSLRLQTLLVTFALKCFPKNIEYVSHCLEQSSAIVTKAGFIAQCAANRDQEAVSIGETVTQIECLLLSPLSVLAMRVLEIPAYTTLMALLPWDNWRGVSSALLQAVITIKTPISTPEELEKLLSSVTPLLKDEPGVAPSVDEDGRDLPATQAFTDEQQLVAKMTHLIKSTDTDTTIRMLIVARTHFAAGGSQRLQHTLTPLVFSALSVVRRVLARESTAAAAAAAVALAVNSAGEGVEKTPKETHLEAVAVPLAFSSRKVFQYVMEISTMLSASSSHSEQALKIFLCAAQAANECVYRGIAYEFMKDAFLLYESEITDSKTQVRSLTAIVGSLLNCKNFAEEDYEALITKAAQYANRLLKKPDQSRMITLCSHLFSPPGPTPPPTTAAAAAGADAANDESGATAGAIVVADASGGDLSSTPYSDPDRVLECLQRALKVASISNPNIFVEILDRYIFFYEKKNPVIKVAYLSGLVALINEQLAGEGGKEGQSGAVETHYRNTLAYIKIRQQSVDTSERFSEIQLSQ